MRRHVLSLAVLSLAGFALAGCPGRGTGGPVEPPADGPQRLAGLATFTGEMLRRGAGERTTAQIAEEIESVGGDLSIETDPDFTAVEIQVLREHLDLAMGILADIAQRPTFPADEIERVRARELDRLAMMQSEPRWLAQQAFRRHLYGEGHPYGHADSEPDSVRRITREQLQAFHGENYVPRNAFIVAVGDVDAGEVDAAAARHFAGWADRPAPDHAVAPPPERNQREVVVVHVPGATQAQISIGNVALRRADPDFIRLRVASQVLGGSASARLFMNLREQCSYTYGVYSGVLPLLGPGPISAGGAVEGQHTAGALREMFREFDAIRSQPAPRDELGAAEAYMIGNFPVVTETAANLAYLVTIQRVFGLPADYWSTYRSNIAAVTADEALASARQYLDVDRGLIVIVGDADQIAEPARRYGPVTVITPEWQVVRRLEAAPGQWPGGEPAACPPLSRLDEGSRTSQPPQPGPARDMEFPPIHESALDNGLQVLTIERRQLPLVVARLVVRSGSAADPL
jgi:zinc protease